MISNRDITIESLYEYLGKHHHIHFAPNDVFGEDGLIVDIQTINLLVKIYETINDTNKSKFNDILQDDYKFANLLDKCWGWVT